MGVALGIFLHELAHAVIGETRLPATGPEEDTADSFSAFTMSTMLDGAHSGNRDFVLGSIKASALLWYYSAKAFEAHNVNHDWQDEHAPDIKRFRNAFCIVFGSDPQAYDALADKVEFGDNARNRCTYDYERQLNAWEELLALRGRNLNDELPGAFPANQPGGKINLVFQTPQDQFGRDTEALLKHNDLVPILVQIMEQYFVWPRDVTITFRDCDEINAWYDPRDGSVTMCYSAIQFYSMFVQRGLSGQL